MFFPFTNYKRVNVPQINTSVLAYTTTATSMIYFVPRGINMESDSQVGIYIQSYFIDTDGQIAHPWIWAVHDSTAFAQDDNQGGDVNGFALKGGHPSSQFGQYLNSPHIVPEGKSIYTFVGDTSDRIGGTLHIFELPEDALV